VIRGIGVDICSIERIERILGRHGDIFVQRVFTDGERKRAGHGLVMAERFSARFAAKEATIKALGGPAGIAWKEMEVVTDENGAPSLVLTGKADEVARKIGVTRNFLSLSHSAGVAVAMVVLEGDE
jgi:holo-[acyl-carrier protein] synthase